MSELEVQLVRAASRVHDNWAGSWLRCLEQQTEYIIVQWVCGSELARVSVSELSPAEHRYLKI